MIIQVQDTKQDTGLVVNGKKVMKTKLTEWLVKPLINEVELPVKVGDEVLMGRFKNKRVKVKSIDYNEKGDLLINGRPALKFRLVKSDKKLLPTKTTNKKSAEPDSDRKGVDDEYPHYKLKEDDKEPKFHSVHRTSTFDKTFERWYANYVPLSTKKMQSIIGKEKVSVFHVGNAEYARDIQQVARIVGKKGTLSTFTSVDKGEKLAKGKGIQSGGGIIYQIEGTLLVASTRDMQSMPDDTGRRWIPIQDLAGKTAGSKMYKELKSAVERNKIDRRSWDKIEREVWEKVKKDTGYGDTQYDHEAHKKNVEKALGPYKRDWIKKYIDIGYKIIDKYKAQIKRNILSQKDKPSEHGWNEILVNQIKIKDVFMLTRSDLHKDEAEKIATGQVTVGSPGKFRKWYNERGGIINEMAIPSPSRAAVKKNKTDRMSGYKKINEQAEVKKIVAIYPGRFQPFGPHHKKVYDALSKRFDEVYITTSAIQQMPRHPLSFQEKRKHMMKMGIPSSRIVQEKSPYVAINAVKKLSKDTAIVYAVGQKDKQRIPTGKKKSGGLTYFQDFKKNLKNLKGHETHGYIFIAPHQKVSGISSGTEIRNLLGSPKVDEKKREQIFKKTFGYFDKSTYETMTSRFGKLFEFYQQPQVKKIIKEVSGFGSSVNASDMSDEGMYDFFGSLDDYFRVSPEHADILGWELIGFPINDTEDMMFTIMADDYEKDRAKTVTYGKTINQDRKNTDSVSNPFPKYKKKMKKNLDSLGWEIVKFFGEKKFKNWKGWKDSPTIDKKDVKKGITHIKKIQEEFAQEVQLLIEGGAYGHMNHPFDDNNLMFSDLKNIVIIGLNGNLNREDKVSEKLDGQNLMVSWVDGKLKAARNKGHLKNGGKTAPTTAGIANMFSGRGNVKKAFVGAMKDLEKSIGGLSKAQKKKVFGNGTKWMNLEVIYPQTSNIIDYDVAEIVFHGTTEYDRTGRAKGYSKESARMLQGMIQQINQNIQKTFKISRPNFLKMSKVQDFGKKKSTFLNKLNKLQSQYGLKDSDRLGQYHESYWKEYIYNAGKQFKANIKTNELVNLTNRWAYFDKSYKIPQMKKDFKDRPEFLKWILNTDKLDHTKMFKQNIKPFEILFFQVGAEILKNMSGFLAVSPDKAVQKIRQDVLNALKDLQKPDNIEKLNKLKIQIEKLEAIGGSSAIVPSEGLVFKYKGNIYKFTGAFAPINQILGSLKFG